MAKLPKPSNLPSNPRSKKPKTVQALKEEIMVGVRALSRHPPGAEYNGEYQRQVEAETNDRGAVLLIGANLENTLELALSRWFVPGRFQMLFGRDKLPDSFAAKISLGYATDIYGEVTFNNLEVVRTIRNAFAHAKIPISFETPEIMAAVNLLNIDRYMPDFMKEEMEKAGPQLPASTRQTAAWQFRHYCHWISHSLFKAYLIPALPLEREALKDPSSIGSGRIVVRLPPLP